ncbi:RNA polymerase sigma factor [Emticicia sp. CRIBPO]|uniref:RNA polymerase sigma factor n=1 Tax=Emticicia sp. CRIBPO TaxID=2683258 RepID=UPI001E320808|nr:sigma-70 family RNA polymerase sigma factor [Emticicia sp. CRIBPO]
MEKSENEYWLSFQKGDEEAYTCLYRLHVKAMFRYGMSLVPASEAFVFDCIHDVFTELWIKREKLSAPDNVRFYLLKALKNRVLHLLERKEKPSKNLESVDFDDLWADYSPEDIMVLGEESQYRQELIKKLIGQLPHRQQEVLRLRFVESLDFQEIADLMSINRQSAQNLTQRAVEKMRGWILKHE